MRITNYCRNNALKINADKSYLLICGTKSAMKAVGNLQLGEIIKGIKSTRNLGLYLMRCSGGDPILTKLLGVQYPGSKTYAGIIFFKFSSKKILADSLVLCISIL